MMSFNFVYKVIKSKCRTQDNTKIENMTRCNISRKSKVEIYTLGEIPREYLYRNVSEPDLLLYGERPLTGIFFPWSRCKQGKARQVDPKPMATLWRDSMIHLRSLWGHLFYTLTLQCTLLRIRLWSFITSQCALHVTVAAHDSPQT